MLEANQAAFALQTGGRIGRVVHHDPRPQAERIGNPVGLVGDHRAKFKDAVTDRDLIAHRHADTAQQLGLRDDPVNPITGRQGGRQVHPAVQHDRAVKRVGACDGLQFDDRALGVRVRAARHGAHFARQRHSVGVGGQPLHRLGPDILRGLADFDIAAENSARVLLQSVDDTGGQRPHRRNRKHAQREASEENTKPAQSVAHLAQRQSPRQRGLAGQSHDATAPPTTWLPATTGHRPCASRDRTARPAVLRG